MPPGLDRFDHIHVYVTDRSAAERWYTDVLGFRRKAELESWAVPRGPLMLQNEPGTVVLALFEQPTQLNRSTIAFGVSGSTFVQWVGELSRALHHELKPVDHGLAWSVYFSDPDGNPFEITTYDYSRVVEHRGLGRCPML